MKTASCWRRTIDWNRSTSEFSQSKNKEEKMCLWNNIWWRAIGKFKWKMPWQNLIIFLRCSVLVFICWSSCLHASSFCFLSRTASCLYPQQSPSMTSSLVALLGVLWVPPMDIADCAYDFWELTSNDSLVHLSCYITGTWPLLKYHFLSNYSSVCSFLGQQMKHCQRRRLSDSTGWRRQHHSSQEIALRRQTNTVSF